MHCSSGDRASALWAVHLSADLGVPIDQAIEFARYSGLANPPFVDLVRHYSPHPAPAGAVFAAAGLRIAAYGEGAMYPPNLAANVAALRTAGWSTLMLRVVPHRRDRRPLLQRHAADFRRGICRRRGLAEATRAVDPTGTEHDPDPAGVVRRRRRRRLRQHHDDLPEQQQQLHRYRAWRRASRPSARRFR